MKIETLEKLIKIISLIRWPFIIILLLAVFWTPVNTLINGVPTIVDNSESISIGSLTIKMKNEIKTKVSGDVTDALYGLSAEAIFEITEIYKITDRILYDEASFGPSIQELVENGMIRVVDDSVSKKWNSEHNKNLLVKVTPLGEQSGAYLKEFLEIFIKELSKSPDTLQSANLYRN